MSLERYQNQLLDEFIWYNDVNDGTIQESIAPGRRWKFDTLRIHFSTAHASTELLVVYISSIKGSGFSQVLISRNMNNSDDYVFNGDHNPYWLFSDDQIIVSLSNSGGNGIGIVVSGWSVQQET